MGAAVINNAVNTDCHLIFEQYRQKTECWKGYHKQGTKMKGGKRVNNCVKSEDAEEGILDVSKYKAIIDDLSKGAFDTESKKELVNQGVKEGVFDVEVVDGKRQVVLTNDAVEKIENIYPELKGKFWECGRCKADYAGCGEAKRKHSEEAEEKRLDHKCWNELSDEHKQLVNAYLHVVRQRTSAEHRQDVRLMEMKDKGDTKELHIQVPGDTLVVQLDTGKGHIVETK